MQRLIRAWTAAGIALLALLLAAFFLTRGSGRPRFEEGDLLVCLNGDGAVELYWPQTSTPRPSTRRRFPAAKPGRPGAPPSRP